MLIVLGLVALSLVVVGIGWGLVWLLGEAGFLALFLVLSLAVGAIIGSAPHWPPR
jgi:hypothetical protein